MSDKSALKLHPEAANTFNDRAESLIGDITLLPPQASSTNTFHPDVFMSAHISKEDIIGEIGFELIGPDEKPIAKFFRHEGKQYGLAGEGFQRFWAIVTGIQNSPSFRDRVSHDSVVETACEWVAKKHRGEIGVSLTEHVITECGKLLRQMELWIPVYRLHIQSEIRMGPCVFRAISASMLEEWEQFRRSKLEGDDSNIKAAFRSERKRIQGTAAIVVEVFAEPGRGYDFAQELAETAVALLNFFHPAHGNPRMRSYTTLLGQENMRTEKILVVENGLIRGGRSSALDKAASPWVLDDAKIRDLKEGGFDRVSALWENEKNSEYNASVLNALLLYSKSSLNLNLTDRLIYILAAIESILLRNNNEPVQKNIGERMAFLIRKTVEERKRIIHVVDEIYRARSSFLHHGQGVKSIDVLEEFMTYAWTAMLTLVLEAKNFQTKSDLLDAIENLKLG